jgi:murein DD-endopeptidase MepM/ murein hydrolase activator NlpD
MLPSYPQTGRRSVLRRWLPLPALLLTLAALVPVAWPAARGEERIASPPTTVAGPSRVPALWMPVTGPVVRGFDARAGPYGPGHRGIDIAAPIGAAVRAPAAGKVVFAGPVAGTTWISLLVAPGVQVGAGHVSSRAPLGRVGPGHDPGSTERTRPGPLSDPDGQAGPGWGATLHLSVRVDGVYVDPLAYLIDRPRARLAPLAKPGGLSDG